MPTCRLWAVASSESIAAHHACIMHAWCRPCGKKLSAWRRLAWARSCSGQDYIEVRYLGMVAGDGIASQAHLAAAPMALPAGASASLVPPAEEALLGGQAHERSRGRASGGREAVLPVLRDMWAELLPLSRKEVRAFCAQRGYEGHASHQG